MATQQALSIDQNANTSIYLTVQVLTNQLLPYNATSNPYVAVDITGASFVMNIAQDYGTAPLIVASTANTKITTTDAPNGLATVSFVPADTSSVPFSSSQDNAWVGVYDIYITDVTGLKTRVFYGTFTINRAVA